LVTLSKDSDHRQGVRVPNSSTASSTPRIHYGWIIVVCGVFTLISCLGFARFAFGMLLPPMSAALRLNYVESGALGAGYFVGYLATIGVIPKLIARFGYRGLLATGLVVIAVTLTLVGLAGGFLSALIFYTMTGIGSALAFLPMVALTARWFAPSRRGAASGIMLSGAGIGIILSGVLIPALERFGPSAGWRAGWLILAGLSAVIAIIAAMLVRNDPKDKGLGMVGENKAASPQNTPTQGSAIVDQPSGGVRSEAWLLAHFGAIYSLYGATYIIYGTFIVTTLVDERGFAISSAGTFWAWVGFFSIFSGWLFGALSDRVGRRLGLMIAYAVLTLAYLLAAVDLGTIPLYLSVGLYGIAAWSIPTIIAAAMGDYLGPDRAATGFAIVTLPFAAGQVIGPLIAGALAELTGGFAIAYGLSAVLTFLAIWLSAALRRVGQ